MAACSIVSNKKPVVVAKVESTKQSASEDKPQIPTASGLQSPSNIAKETKPAKVQSTTNSSNPLDLWQRMRAGFKLPELNTKRVKHYEHQFTARPESIERIFTRAQWFLPDILEEVEKRGYPTEVALLPAVESAFKPDAKSHSGASGLWQFIASTGRLYGMHENEWYDARRDPELSTEAALTFLGELNQRFDGDWLLSFAGYNAGGKNIEKAIKHNKRKNKPTHFSALKLPNETAHYVPKLVAFRNIIRNPERYNITLPKMPHSASIAGVDAGTQTDLSIFAAEIGVDSNTLLLLNRAYKHGVTPPDGPHRIQVPVAKLHIANSKIQNMRPQDKMRWAHYKVKPGDILGRISKKYKVSIAAIRRTNKLKSNTIYPEKILLIPMINAQVAGQSKASTKANIKVSKVTQSTDKNQITHRVRKGDTLWQLAKRYGVKVAQISRWNKISESQTLQLAQKLVIYPHA